MSSRPSASLSLCSANDDAGVVRLCMSLRVVELEDLRPPNTNAISSRFSTASAPVRRMASASIRSRRISIKCSSSRTRRSANLIDAASHPSGPCFNAPFLFLPNPRQRHNEARRTSSPPSTKIVNTGKRGDQQLQDLKASKENDGLACPPSGLPQMRRSSRQVHLSEIASKVSVFSETI